MTIGNSIVVEYFTTDHETEGLNLGNARLQVKISEN